MEITSVEKNKKDREMLSVYIDSQYAFSIKEEDYMGLNLYEKKDITKDDVDFIKNTINYRSAKSCAVKYLSLKLHSEKEVRDKLRDEGYDEDTSENVIEELKAMGYINDLMYVQKFIYDRSKLKPQSKKMLKYELQNRGISADTIDQVLNDWEMDELSIAISLAKRKFGKYDVNDESISRKVYSFLHHRGFEYDLISQVLRYMKESK